MRIFNGAGGGASEASQRIENNVSFVVARIYFSSSSKLVRFARSPRVEGDCPQIIVPNCPRLSVVPANFIPGGDDDDQGAAERHEHLTHGRRVVAQEGVDGVHLGVVDVSIVESFLKVIRTQAFCGPQVNSVPLVENFEIFRAGGLLLVGTLVAVARERLVDDIHIQLGEDILQIGNWREVEIG